ncbi:TIGR03084 family metal-binding protein [Streptomyces sp. NPDC006684]|uniref:TIGR03084 family metal-binding protein n=1 Tax=Streptomyces sp. NPDC006684 TaxID=3154477 RepID=UPI0034535D72
MVDPTALLTDLAEESAALDRVVADLPATAWERETPSPGWTVAHQIAHLAWTDHAALLAVTEPEEFAARLARVRPERLADEGAEEFRTAPAALLEGWRAGRTALAEALARVPGGTRIAWIGTRMAPASMVTARLMETWAHGQDVHDALSLTRPPTARLRHIAHLGFRTLGHGFATYGRPVPTAPVRVELAAPDGDTWAHGPADAANRVTGPALDFCLLVTQRRHRADLALTATGPVAAEWLDVAQAFAGPPGEGRRAGGGAGRLPAGDAGQGPVGAGA